MSELQGRISHQLTESGVLIVLRPPIGAPSSLRVSEQEAKRFAYAMLGELEPDAAHGSSDGTIVCGAIEINLDTGDVKVAGRGVHFTAAEFALLSVLARRPGVLLSKDQIFSHIYAGRDEPELKIVDVFVCKIRNKLRPHGCAGQLETSWGRGYRLVEQPTIEAFDLRQNAGGPPSPVQSAVMERVLQAPATFPEIWGAMPLAPEGSVRNALAVLVNRGDIERSGEPKRAVYRRAESA